MTKTQTPTPDQLCEQAASLAAQAAEVQAEIDAQTVREWEAEQEAQAERDRQTVATYDRARLDAAVDQARTELEQAVADWPVTKALGAYISAGYRRAWAHFDYAGARSRLDLPDPGQAPHPAHVEPLADVVTRAATNAAQAVIDAERSQA